MATAREDYLLRLIQEMGAVLRRLRARLLGAQEGADAVEVREEAAAAVGQLLGPHAAVLEHLDVSSAVTLIADPQRVALWVQLLLVQAMSDERLGQAAPATARRARAAALETAARARWGAEYHTAL
jgi:hypothetical protein